MGTDNKYDQQPDIRMPITGLPGTFKIYSATLTQTGTNAPVATVHNNTIGNIVWTRHNQGDYRGTLAGAFTAGNTFFLQGGGAGVNALFYPDRLDDNTIQILAYNTGSAGDDWSRFNLQILVYNSTSTFQFIPEPQAGVKQYTAIMSQTGTDAPIANVLQNTVGNIVWTRQALGLYKGTLNGAFTVGKTICKPFGQQHGALMIGIANALPFDNAYTVTTYSVDAIRIETLQSSDYSSVEWSTVYPDNILVDVIIYP